MNNKLFPMVITLLFALCVPTVSMSDKRLDHFFSKARAVTENGQIVVYGRDKFHRLWGVDPDVKYLEELIVERILDCVVLGEFYKIPSTLEVIQCGLDGGLALDANTITEHLISTGHGREICVETRNYFGTCE